MFDDHPQLQLPGPDAVGACRKRFKNAPDRHFHSVKILIKHYFDHKADL